MIQLPPTDGVNLVHENDAGLMVAGVIEHLSNQPGALADVLVHDCAGNHLERRINKLKAPLLRNRMDSAFQPSGSIMLSQVGR